MTTLRDCWLLDPDVVFLNHGSFGACPKVVLAKAEATRARLEREPVRFLVHELEGLLDEARAAIATPLGADAEDLAFVPNATTGASTVIRSLRLQPGDELLTTDHAYNACRQALEEVAASSGARVVTAHVPFPIASPGEVTAAVLAGVSPRTRLCLLDYVTSPTAIVFPVAEIVRELEARGVPTLVDAAHAPGMIPLHLDAIGAAYTAGNFHKWMCAPKSAGFLHVRRDLHATIRPLTVSHGRNAPRTDRSRFRLEHDWTGTFDPAPYLAVPEAIRFVEGLPGGLTGWMDGNHAAAVRARRRITEVLGVEAPCPETMLGSMASVPLPAGLFGDGEPIVGLSEALHRELFVEHRIEIPVFLFPAPRRLLRVSTPAYVTDDDIGRLTSALAGLARS